MPQDKTGPTKEDARAIALDLLFMVISEGIILSEGAAQTALDKLQAPQSRARAQRLVLGVLRNLGAIDRLLQAHLNKRPPPKVQNILRLASYEICDGGEAYGIVDDAVSRLGKSHRLAAFKGLGNAVLRKIATPETQAQWRKRAPQKLPKWLRQTLRKKYSQVQIAAIEKACAEPAPLDLSLRDHRQAAHWRDTLGAKILPCGGLRLQNYAQITQMPGYAEGAWWIQDAAASLPAQVLAPRKGEAVLDLCAAPGGKSMQMAAMGAHVTAVDISAARLARLRENHQRCGLPVTTDCADILAFHAQAFGAILLDAPCSATGTLRRHPDLPFAKNAAQIDALLAIQQAMLRKAFSLLQPAGRMVYATCSLLPQEGEAQIAEFLSQTPDCQQIPINPLPFGLPQDTVTQGGALCTRPDFWAEEGGMDGFYIALLQKDAIIQTKES